MTARLTTLSPNQLAERLKQGAAVLVDIREPDEFARRHVRGAISRPLSGFEAAGLKVKPAAQVVFACRTGMRTASACDRLAAAIDGEAFVLEGGLDGWTAAGLPVEEDRRAPLEIMRQVQIAAGSLVIAGVGLGLSVHPAFFGLAAFVGAGLAMAGATGFCGMARLLAAMPWNRTRAA
jgi:rhodanese-related sulfurtransferase